MRHGSGTGVSGVRLALGLRPDLARAEERGRHKTVKVARSKVDIDEKLAPLIRLVWDVGIDTNQCCQEARPREACIEFHSSADVEQFLFVAQRDYKPELEVWDEADHHDDELSHIRVRLLVYFPTKDISSLVNAFEQVTQANETDHPARQAARAVT